MKLVVALAAAGLILPLTASAPAIAQKDPACIEKCTRQNVAPGGTMQKRGTAELVRGCIRSCPRAKAGGKAM
jgi:hypothetical protein